MLVCSRLLLVLSAIVVTIPVAQAQRGSLIEDLFRTIAEAQLEREQRKRVEAEQNAQPPVANPAGSLQTVPIAPGGTPSRGPGGATLDRGGRPPSINVGSRAVADFAHQLVEFSAAIDSLVSQLRADAASHPTIRSLLPEAYRVAADARTVIQRCDGLASLDPILDPYAALDSRWRQLSFQLRAIDSLSSRSTAHIRTCDRLVGTIERQLQIDPQFDRHQLHDQMIIAATYMETLMDDLQLAHITRQEAERLTHDCRLLRQRLLSEADRVEETTYEDVVTRFTNFLTQWNPFSERVYSLNDPYLQRRLDRIRQCGDRIYAVLWMPPPYNANTLTASAHRLEQSCLEILDQLTLRAMVALKAQDQVRVLEASRRMYQQSRDLEVATTGNSSRRDLQAIFAGIDQDWAYLRATYSRLPTLNRSTLASIDHECDQLRGALGMRSVAGSAISRQELIQLAAELEGAADYLRADVLRYERYLQPVAYQRSLTAASQAFYGHAKQLHAELSGQADLGRLQRQAELLMDAWQTLSRDLGVLGDHGLSQRRAESLQQAQQEMVPPVAQIAAALLER